MLSPLMARMMKQVAVTQCTKRSNALKAHHGAPGAARLDLDHAADQVEQHQHDQHAEDDDGADPGRVTWWNCRQSCPAGWIRTWPTWRREW
jgi:hypothetical protein